MLNLAVLMGTLSSPPDIRSFDSGSRLAALQVRVPDEGGRATSVPVALWDPPDDVAALAPGDEVVVVGRVVRRFFPVAGGRRASRTEVVAEAVAGTGQRRKVSAALRRARTVLESAR